MLLAPSTMFFLSLTFALSALPPRAQEHNPSDETTEARKPYVPPPAWKSVEIADFYLKRKKYNAALSRYQEAVKTDPYYAPSYLGLGKVYEKIGLKKKALEAYQKYLDTLPSTRQADEAKEAHQAIARLERALKISGSGRSSPSSRSNAPSQRH